jgi:hypothetical protein
MDDWSLLPSRNAVREPAPDPQSTMTTTTLPARLTHPRQAPPSRGVDHPRPQTTALDPAGLPWQPRNQSGANPQNPNHHRPHDLPTSREPARTSTTVSQPLDTSRPFMDDTGPLLCARSRRAGGRGVVDWGWLITVIKDFVVVVLELAREGRVRVRGQPASTRCNLGGCLAFRRQSRRGRVVVRTRARRTA